MPDQPARQTSHLGLPLPSPNAGDQIADIDRIARSLTAIDEAVAKLDADAKRRRLESTLGINLSD